MIIWKNLINGAMGLDQLGQVVFQLHNAGQSPFQLVQAALACDYVGDGGDDADADADAGGARRSRFC